MFDHLADFPSGQALADHPKAAAATHYGHPLRAYLGKLIDVRMAAIHQATMRAAGRLNRSETIDQHAATCGALNKLVRTFATQIEALKRYRSVGEQIVEVTDQHVSVTAGQAVVGIGGGGRGVNENESQSHALEATAEVSQHDAGGTALLGPEQAFGLPLPRTDRKGAQRPPHARRASRATEGAGQRRLASWHGDR